MTECQSAGLTECENRGRVEYVLYSLHMQWQLFGNSISSKNSSCLRKLHLI